MPVPNPDLALIADLERALGHSFDLVEIADYLQTEPDPRPDLLRITTLAQGQEDTTAKGIAFNDLSQMMETTNRELKARLFDEIMKLLEQEPEGSA